MSLRTVRRLYFVALVVLIAGFLFVPVFRSAGVAGVGLVGAAAVVYGAVTQRSPRLGAWLTIALGITVLSAGDVVHSAIGSPTGPSDYPNVPDAFYLACYLPLSVGLLWLGRPRVASRDWAMLLDTVALSLAGGLVVWISLVRPAVLTLHLSTSGKVIAIASWVGYVAVLAACARIVSAWRANLALSLLSLGVLAFLISDYLYGVSLVNGTGLDAGPVDLGFLVFAALAGWAALTSSMTKVASAPYARHQLGPWRLAVLAVALLIGPSTLLIEATGGLITTAVAIGVVSGSVGLLMLVRLALTGQAYRTRAVREHATRVATRALVVATTSEEVQAGLASALANMLPANTYSGARLLEPGEVTRAESGGEPRDKAREPTDVTKVDDVVLTDGEWGELRVAVQPGAARKDQRIVVFNAPSESLTELTPVLQALAEQAGSALSRIELIARLRADDRERYFRTLVLTSTDVILISRNGRIEYATPSAAAMFGRDVIGESFDDVVRPNMAGRQEAEAGGSNVTVPSIDGNAVEALSDRVGQGQERAWSDFEEGVEGFIRRPDGTLVDVLVHRRNLTDDPSVNGVVTTLRDVTAERELRRSLAYRASHDALTGLANADLLREQLRADRINRGDAGGDHDRLSVVLFIDLDDFKAVNDNYGHEIGDGLLVTVAHRIQSCLRTNDLAARLGGDEFAALLRDVPDPQAAFAVAQRIAENLSRPANVAGITVDCQASIGLAIARTPAEFDSLMRRADTALYTAKADGKGQWRQYRDDMINPVRRRTDLRDELETAIRENKLTLQYQPIVELATGRAIGYEALIRFDRVAGPPMQPQELIGIAEDNALILSLGDWILRQALSDVDTLNRGHREPRRYVSVNVSVRQLRQPGFADTVRAHLEAAGVSASMLVIEITESLLLSEDERAWGYLADLRNEGVRVAIDDYGTGYASLSYLRQSAIDIVKIDRRFLDDLGTDRSRILLEAVLRVTEQLGLQRIAEGVESNYTRDVLLAMGCRYGQGFLYAQAMPPARANEWVWSNEAAVSQRPKETE